MVLIHLLDLTARREGGEVVFESSLRLDAFDVATNAHLASRTVERTFTLPGGGTFDGFSAPRSIDPLTRELLAEIDRDDEFWRGLLSGK